MEKALSIQNLTVSYDDHTALHNINFEIEKGRLAGVIGPNGAGKSTLMKAALGLIAKDRGTIEFYGKPVKQMRKNIAYIPQRNNIDWNFPINVLDAVVIGTYPKLGVFHRPKKADREWAHACLKQVGMDGYSKRQIGELSGGQQQRVFMARALTQKAQIFFLDEPFVGIDASSEETIIKILKKLRNDGKTVIVIHHDLSKAKDYFDNLVLLNEELIEAGLTESVLRPETLGKAYEAQLPFLQPAEAGV